MMRYSPSETARTAGSLLLTKLFFRGARLVRRPVYLRGRRYLSFGAGLTTGYGCRFDLGLEAPAASEAAPGGKTLVIGRDCRMGDHVHIVASERVEIGDSCLMASKIFISDTTHGTYSGPDQSSPDTDPSSRALGTRPVRIGNNVWIGENVCVLPGVTIGDGAIINSNAVVTKDVRPGCIVAGVPAVVLKEWDAALRQWVRA